MSKNNYRPTSILSNLSKIYERYRMRLFLRIFLKLLIVYAYGFDKISLKYRQQKTKVGSTFRKLMGILFGVPRESIIGHFFIIYICDLFILNDHLEFGSYADDTIPLFMGKILTK